MHREKVFFLTSACHHSVPFPGDNRYDQFLMKPFVRGTVSRFLFKGIGRVLTALRPQSFNLLPFFAPLWKKLGC